MSFGWPTRSYVGLAVDVQARLAVHNSGGSSYTTALRPWELVAAVEFTRESSALAFEKYLKSGSGRAFAKRHFDAHETPAPIPGQWKFVDEATARDPKRSASADCSVEENAAACTVRARCRHRGQRTTDPCTETGRSVNAPVTRQPTVGSVIPGWPGTRSIRLEARASERACAVSHRR